MDEILLLNDMPSVCINGFKVSFGKHRGDILIEREGRRCKHYFVSKNKIENSVDYGTTIEEAILDFIKTARIGGGQRKDYIERYCSCESNKDIADAWRDYRSSYLKLKRLLGCDPSEFLATLD